MQAQYKANTESWVKFKKNPNSLERLNQITEEILRPDISLEESLRLFEGAVKETSPANQTFTHYLRPIHTSHHADASKPGYQKKLAILITLQCAKACIVGFGHVNSDCHTATSDFLELVFYPFLKGITIYSLISSHWM
jgi:exonuclease VII small subunit